MKMGKILFYLLIAVIIASAIIMMALPSIISSDKGKETLVSYVNHAIPGTLAIKNLNVSWTSPSDLEGVELRDEQGKPLVTVGALTINDPFWKLLMGMAKDLSLNIKQLDATVVSNESGTTNIERALSFDAAKRPIGNLLEPIEITDVNVTSQLERGGNLAIQGTGKTRQGTLIGGFKLDGSLHEHEEKSRLLSFQAQKLPVLLLDQLAHVRLATPVGLLQKVLGNEMSVNAQINGSTAEALFTTPMLSTKAEGIIENEIFKLKNPLVIDLKLTPESSSALHQAYPSYQFDRFKNGGALQFEISNLEFPLEHPEQAHFNFKTSAKDTSKFSLQAEGEKNEKGVQLTGNFSQESLSVEKFRFTVDEASIKNFQINPKNANFIGIIFAEKITMGSSFSMKVAESPWSYQATSKTFKVEPKVIMDRETLQGPITLQQLGENLRFDAQIKGYSSALTAQGQIAGGVITLSAPLEAELTLTKGLADHFLDDIIPLLDSASHAEHPLRLTISNQGFSMPISAFSGKLGAANIGSATLDLQRIYFTKDGKLAQILSLLKLPPTETFSVWFTPIYVSMSQGVLHINRFDLLIADKAPVASWGNVDFPGDSVRMHVGLTGRALSSVVGLLPLPKSYMLSLPLKGPLANPKLDTKIITAKLAGLAAMATGPQGMLVGALVNLAAGTFSETIPEPTTQPLPWNVDAENVQGEDQSNKKEDKGISDPTKGLKKEANKIINNLFGK